MISGNPIAARALGVVIHYIVLGTVVFGLIYAALFSAFGSARWWVGLLIGVVHGAVVGLVIPMMPAMHPRMMQRAAAATRATASGVATSDRVRIPAPGLFGVRWGAMTPIGVLVGPAVYGVVLAVIYSRLG